MGVQAPTIVRATLERISRTDLLVLLAVLITLVGSWAFLEIVDEVSEGETQRLDAWVVRSLRRPADAAAPDRPTLAGGRCARPYCARWEVGADPDDGDGRSVPLARPDLPRHVDGPRGGGRRTVAQRPHESGVREAQAEHRPALDARELLEFPQWPQHERRGRLPDTRAAPGPVHRPHEAPDLLPCPEPHS